MATYVSLMSLTQKGIEAIKESPARRAAAKKMIESMGGKWIGFYMLFGEWDFLAITEAPDDATAAKVLLMIAGQGNIRTHTMKALTEAECDNVLKSLP